MISRSDEDRTSACTERSQSRSTFHLRGEFTEKFARDDAEGVDVEMRGWGGRDLGGGGTVDFRAYHGAHGGGGSALDFWGGFGCGELCDEAEVADADGEFGRVGSALGATVGAEGEVDEVAFGGAGVAFVFQEDVGGLEVAVDHVLRVQIFDAVEEAEEDLERGF